MKRFLLAALLLLIATPALAQDNCTFPTETTTWDAICTLGTGSFTCTGGDNSCDANDRFTCPSGATITTGGNITSTALEVADWLTLQSGCSMTFDAGHIITMGSSSAADNVTMRVLEGATFSVTGTFFDYGDTTESSDYSPTDYYQVGEIIPAPGVCDDLTNGTVIEPDVGGDCSGGGETPGDANITRFSYSDAVYNASGADTIPDGFAALVDDETVAYFFDPVPTDTYTPSQANVPYIVTGHSVSAPYYFEIDMRQCSTLDCDDPAFYPLATRAWQECVLQSAVERGGRTFTVDSACISATGEREGQWAFLSDNDEPCDDGDAVACALDPRPYLVMRTTDGGAGDDTLTLVDRRGVHKALASGGPIWLSPGGFQGGATGDPVAFGNWSTLRCADATSADHNECAITYADDYSIHGLVYDGIGRVANFADTGFTGDAGSVEEYVWHRDGGSNALVQRTFAIDFAHTLRHYAHSGNNANDPDNCVVAEGATAGILNVEDSSYRHCDAGPAANLANTVNLTRVAMEYIDRGGTSGSGTVGDATDIYVVKADLDGTSPALIGIAEFTNALVLAGSRPLQLSADGRNLFVAGWDYTSGPGLDHFTEGTTLRGAVVRDNVHTQAGAGLVDTVGISENELGFQGSHLLVHSNSYPGTSLRVEGDTSFTDSVFFNESSASSVRMLEMGGDTAPFLLRNVGFFNTLADPGWQEVLTVVQMDADNHDEARVTGIFCSGFTTSTCLNLAEWDLIAECSNVALWNNNVDAHSSALTGCSPSRDRPPGVIDFSDIRDLRTWGGSPAAQEEVNVPARAGIAREIWPMSRAKLPPETAGVVVGGGGAGRGPRSY